MSLADRTRNEDLRAAQKRALIAVVVGALMVAAYVFSFVYAQASPTAHELPVGIVGPAGEVSQAEREIEQSTGDAFDVTRYGDELRARNAIRDRDTYGALVLSPDGPKVLTAPAAGESAATQIETRLPRAAGLAGQGPPRVVEVRPLVADDPQGDALNLTILPLIIFGIVMPVLLTNLAAMLPVRARLGAMALFAVLSGLAAVLVAHAALDALPGPFLALSALAALLIFGVASMTLAFMARLGPAGAGVGFLLFLVIGNVASGAAVVHEMLPGAWRVVGPWLPPGAAATAIRNAAYFDGAKLLQPLIVLIAFAIAGAALCLIGGGRRPAPQGEPSGPTPDATPATAA